MNRRAFMVGATASLGLAIADPTQARPRRMRSAGRRRYFTGRRRSYQPVSYSDGYVNSRAMGRVPAARIAQVPMSAPPRRQSKRDVQAVRDIAKLPERRTPGMLSRDEVAKFSLKGQTRSSMLRKYGTSMRTDNNQDIYEVTGTSDGIRAPGRFVVTYGNNGKAISAYTENY